ADEAGRAGFVRLLQSGGTETDVGLGIVTSEEFRARAGDEAGYARALFRALLSREAVPGGGQGVAGVPPQAIARAVLFSDEAIGRAALGDYNVILGRLAAPSEQALWVPPVRATGSFFTITLGVLSSPEVFALANSGR